MISIHALLAESDHTYTYLSILFLDFYPRSPCGERRSHYRCSGPFKRFLSTLSLRRATIKPIFSKINTRDFYPRSPCGERHTHPVTVFICIIISIHALLAESDVVSTLKLANAVLFLSTLSLRRATSAPRITPTASRNFYPRSPCGERQTELDRTTSKITFLSTLSLRRATASSTVIVILRKNFYPRSPCGERPIHIRICQYFSKFLSTLSLRRATIFRKEVIQNV